MKTNLGHGQDNDNNKSTVSKSYKNKKKYQIQNILRFNVLFCILMFPQSCTFYL